MLRTFLIITIVVAICATALNQFVTRPHVQALIDARNKNLAAYQAEQRLHTGTRASLAEAVAKFQETEKALATKTAEVKIANDRITQEQERFAGLDRDLKQTSQELSLARADLAAWKALGLPVERVRQVAELNKALQATNEVIQKELAILMRAYDGPRVCFTNLNDAEAILPTNTRGKVLAVDPKYDFVVLDIGSRRDIVPNGVLIVSRNSRLVGKVRITSVQPDRCIANVLPGWKRDQILEGDQVFY